MAYIILADAYYFEREDLESINGFTMGDEEVDQFLYAGLPRSREVPDTAIIYFSASEFTDHVNRMGLNLDSHYIAIVYRMEEVQA